VLVVADGRGASRFEEVVVFLTTGSTSTVHTEMLALHAKGGTEARGTRHAMRHQAWSASIGFAS
jgi:hypothetical protein